MKTNKISILGCGWLGLPLAKEFISKGFSVKGSTTSIDKMAVLETNDIQPFLIAVSEDGIEGEMTDFLENSNLLIIDIPPKLRGENKENFVLKIKNLIPFIEKASIEKVLFISSTSVYADDNSIVTEETIPNPDTESGKQLLEAEKLLQHNSNFKTTILRFGGLIGEDRHPIKHISGRENLENPEGAINLIHLDDCIGIIESLVASNYWGETFNAVSPHHPTRYNYYSEKAISLDWPLPKFRHDKPSHSKVISSAKVEKILQYQFKTAL
ncbi:SDR family NAD(P)-dependent oxidoreductase [Flavobacterium sp.]|uniref:SDR family NAD(P)-dependent oxidoreductase n=1 Tax=Flavobacterium sp. TaxID=239 RepID=UPI00260BE8BE|nr:SDR family NAD(P)-dependent oxidoreductase [Flavobacterium sp.]